MSGRPLRKALPTEENVPCGETPPGFIGKYAYLNSPKDESVLVRRISRSSPNLLTHSDEDESSPTTPTSREKQLKARKDRQRRHSLIRESQRDSKSEWTNPRLDITDATAPPLRAAPSRSTSQPSEVNLSFERDKLRAQVEKLKAHLAPSTDSYAGRMTGVFIKKNDQMRVREELLFSELQAELGLRRAALILENATYERPVAAAGSKPAVASLRNPAIEHELSDLRSKFLSFQLSSERAREDPGTTTASFARGQSQVAGLLAQWDDFCSQFPSLAKMKALFPRLVDQALERRLDTLNTWLNTTTKLQQAIADASAWLHTPSFAEADAAFDSRIYIDYDEGRHCFAVRGHLDSRPFGLQRGACYLLVVGAAPHPLTLQWDRQKPYILVSNNGCAGSTMVLYVPADKHSPDFISDGGKLVFEVQDTVTSSYLPHSTSPLLEEDPLGLMKKAVHFAHAVLPQIKRSLDDVKIADFLNDLNTMRLPHFLALYQYAAMLPMQVASDCLAAIQHSSPPAGVAQTQAFLLDSTATPLQAAATIKSLCEQLRKDMQVLSYMSMDTAECLSSDLVAREFLIGLNFCHQTERIANLYGQHLRTYVALLLRGQGVGRFVYTLEFLIEEWIRRVKQDPESDERTAPALSGTASTAPPRTKSQSGWPKGRTESAADWTRGIAVFDSDGVVTQAFCDSLQTVLDASADAESSITTERLDEDNHAELFSIDRLLNRVHTLLSDLRCFVSASFSLPGRNEDFLRDLEAHRGYTRLSVLAPLARGARSVFLSSQPAASRHVFLSLSSLMELQADEDYVIVVDESEAHQGPRRSVSTAHLRADAPNSQQFLHSISGSSDPVSPVFARQLSARSDTSNAERPPSRLKSREDSSLTTVSVLVRKPHQLAAACSDFARRVPVAFRTKERCHMLQGLDEQLAKLYNRRIEPLALMLRTVKDGIDKDTLTQASLLQYCTNMLQHLLRCKDAKEAVARLAMDAVPLYARIVERLRDADQAPPRRLQDLFSNLMDFLLEGNAISSPADMWTVRAAVQKIVARTSFGKSLSQEPLDKRTCFRLHRLVISECIEGWLQSGYAFHIYPPDSARMHPLPVGRVLDAPSALANRELHDEDRPTIMGTHIHFRRLKWLDEGAFGRVSLVIDLSDNQLLALKEPKRSNGRLDEVRREWDMLAPVRHPYILRYVALETSESSYRLFSEYCSYGTLRKLIDRDEVHGDAQIRSFIAQILLGLEHLHEKRIVHRDLKSANILVNSELRLKIADFGQAVTIGERATGRPHGTVAFMPPEVINGQQPDNPVIDVWSLGCVLIELSTGRVPYEEMNVVKENLLLLIGREQIRPRVPEDLDSEGKSFCQQCFLPYQSRPSARQLLSHPFVVASLRGLHG